MTCDVKLLSDFSDYYDSGFNKSGNIIYPRMYSDVMPRGKALNTLKSMGIPILPLKPASHYSTYECNKLVVYTNPKLHNGKGKMILSVNQARTEFSNCLATPFIENTQGVSLKYLQIGSIGLQLYMYNQNEGLTLEPGNVFKVEHSVTGFNPVIKLPIFSIDYISVKGNMVAIDFNEVENLGKLGIDRFLPAEFIIKEVEKALKN